MEQVPIRAAVAEDEPAFRTQLHDYLRKYAEETDTVIEVKEYENGRDLTETYRPVFDVIFLDIEMPLLDGMSAAEIIREKDERVILVFVTNIAHYAVKGYEVQALDYILKPVQYASFAAKMDRIVKTVRLRQEKGIVLNTGNGLRRITESALLYVEVLRHQVIYHLEGESIVVRGSLKDAEKLLEGCSFEKCNSCYLVNLRHVRGIRNDTAVVGQEELQISRSRKKGFMQAVADYVGSV